MGRQSPPNLTDLTNSENSLRGVEGQLQQLVKDELLVWHDGAFCDGSQSALKSYLTSLLLLASCSHVETTIRYCIARYCEIYCELTPADLSDFVQDRAVPYGENPAYGKLNERLKILPESRRDHFRGAMQKKMVYGPNLVFKLDGEIHELLGRLVKARNEVAHRGYSSVGEYKALCYSEVAVKVSQILLATFELETCASAFDNQKRNLGG